MARLYTDEELLALIECPKLITKGPRKTMIIEAQHQRNEMDLVAKDDEALTFHVFMRRNEHFKENFTIGLHFRHIQERDTICLFRCNGPHGNVSGQRECSAHFEYHIHRARQSNIASGRRPEHGAEETKEYASYEDALTYFLEAINILNVHEFFPERRQPPLFLLDDENEVEL